MVNHVVKNAFAEAEAALYLLIESDASRYCVEAFDSVFASLKRGMRWCKNYQAGINLLEGAFVPNARPVNVWELGSKILGARCIHSHFSRAVITVDPVLCDIMLENLLDNAKRHGHKLHPDVHCSITVATPAVPSPNLPGVLDHQSTCRVTFKVTNRADPGKDRLPEDLVAQVLANRRPCGGSSPLSDGLGLKHAFLAANALGLTYNFRQDGDTVSFVGTTETTLVRDGTSETSNVSASHSDPPDCPGGLKVYCIEDSGMMRTWLCSVLSSIGTVEAFGAAAEDAAAFVAAALRDGDIAICDQNLEFGSTTVYGTELLKELKIRGFTGLLCIHSANDSVQDQAKYGAAGVHLTIGKGSTRSELLHSIKRAYWDTILASRIPHIESCQILAAHDVESVSIGSAASSQWN